MISNQLILFACFRCPKSVKKFTIKRIIEILQLAASEHHRLSCYIDPDTITTHPLCETAQDLPALVSVYPKVTQDTWKKVYMTDLNTNFEVGVKKPLWRTSIIVPPHVLLEEADDFINDDLLKQELREKFGNSSGGVDGKKQGKGEILRIFEMTLGIIYLYFSTPLLFLSRCYFFIRCIYS